MKLELLLDIPEAKTKQECILLGRHLIIAMENALVEFKVLRHKVTE